MQIILQHEFQPVFTEADLINVDVYNAYVKTIVNNEPVPAFSMDTTKDMAKEKASENPRVAELIRELSRLKYGKDVNALEAKDIYFIRVALYHVSYSFSKVEQKA